MSAPAPGVVSEAALPLHWQAREPSSEGAVCEEAQHLLQACMVLEEGRHRSEDGDAASAEIERLHVKMNLVLDVLAGLLAQQSPRPPALPVQLSAEQVVWVAATEPPATGECGWVSLYLHPLLPRPIRLPAVVTQVQGREVCARFESLTPGTQALLERYVFHHHRRAIAERRSPGAC